MGGEADEQDKRAIGRLLRLAPTLLQIARHLQTTQPLEDMAPPPEDDQN